MKSLLLFVGVPIGAFLFFLSGSAPYTLIYDEETLSNASFTGDEPVTVDDFVCEVQDADSVMIGDVLSTTFSVTFKNNTDRFVVVSALGEVYAPKGSAGIHSQMMILSPESTERTSFRSNTPHTGPGRYTCPCAVFDRQV